MSPVTLFLAKLLGLLFVVFSVAMALDRRTVITVR